MLFNLKKLTLFMAIIAAIGAASFTITKNPFSKHAIEDNPKIKKLRLSEGFAAEHIYSPSANNRGSWVAMAFDDKGRLITSDQYGKLIDIADLKTNVNQFNDISSNCEVYIDNQEAYENCINSAINNTFNPPAEGGISPENIGGISDTFFNSFL